MSAVEYTHAPYSVGDHCEWLYVEPGFWHDGGPQSWIDAEVIDVRPSCHGWDVRVRMGVGWPSCWTRWIWVDYDGDGWDKFPDRDVHHTEVAEYCRHRLRPIQNWIDG